MSKPQTATTEKSEKEIRNDIVAQAIRELQWARIYKQGKIKNWQLNETMYYTKAIKQSYATGLNYGSKSSSTNGVQASSRSNVNLARMQEFVHTLWSKIDNPLVFKFVKKHEAQLKRVKRLNALRESDRNSDFWDIKDLVGKKQGIVYGRAIYCYYADSMEGYKAHLENVDVYDFLIDPSGGGLDLEQARFMGRYGVVKTRQELLEGVKAGTYLEDETDEVLDGGANNTETPQEETNKLNRMYGQNTIGKKEMTSDDKFKFWEWYTTYFNEETGKSERYYLLMQERAGKCIRMEKLTDLFSATKEFPLGPWPFWSYAVFPDLTEFWTPSYCDYVRELFMAQDVTINQMLDNAEAINKPMRKVQVDAIENLSELKYRREGLIKVKGDVDVNKAYQIVETPPIETPLKVFDKLEEIQEKVTGTTDQTKGVSDEDGTLGIYQGQQEEVADRFGLLNKSYSFGYARFAKLYELGVRDNLTKKIAIEMIGPDGVETEEVSKRDIFRKSETFSVKVEASDAEEQASKQTQKTKLDFLKSQLDMQNAPNTKAPKIINPQKALEVQAKIAGFSEDDIKELMDVSEYGSGELLSEAASDIEKLLDGEKVQPNPAANNAYKQKIVDWMIDHQEDMKPALFQRMAAYVVAISPIVIKNEARAVMQFKINQLNQGGIPANPEPEGAVLPPAQLMPQSNGQPTA